MLHSLLLVAALLVVGDGPRICTPTKPGPTICVDQNRKPEVAEPFSSPSPEFCGPNLPSFTKQLSNSDYKRWVMEQNEIAYDVAAQSAAVARTGPGSLVTETTVVGQSSGRFRGYNNLRTREVQTIAPGAAQFGGGPVWIHNPFVRQ